MEKICFGQSLLRGFNRLFDLWLIKMFVQFNGKTNWAPEFPCKYGSRILSGSEFGIMEAHKC